jgi:hypothetical protein
MNVNLPHVVTISDLFCNFDVNKLKGDGNIKRKYKCEDKKALVKKIFLRYLYHLIYNMVEGGKTLILPSRKYVQLSFKPMKQAFFKRCLQKGYYQDVDILMSNFKFYELMVTYSFAGKYMTRPVKLSPNFVSQLINKVNTGYVYC